VRELSIEWNRWPLTKVQRLSWRSLALAVVNIELEFKAELLEFFL
jgi:hypothetical protein